MPAIWRVGGKTGSGSHGESNDVAILWPSERKPLLVAVDYAEPGADAAQTSEVLNDVGRRVALMPGTVAVGWVTSGPTQDGPVNGAACPC